MCRIPNTAFVLGIMALCSCTNNEDGLQQPPSGEDIHSISIGLSRGVQEDFISAGVDRYTIYVYHNDRKDKSLYLEQEMNVSDNNVTLQFSLGDNFRIFAVANAKAVVGKEDFETVELKLDPASDSQMWMTEVTTFTSDKSVTNIDMSMQRLVARVEFVPAEDAETLATQTYFDTLALKFTNTADSYKVCDASVTPNDYVLRVDKSTSFQGGFYTFASSDTEGDSMLEISYINGDTEVNKSAGALETGVKYTSNNLYHMIVPILTNDYVDTPWSRSSYDSTKSISVNITHL